MPPSNGGTALFNILMLFQLYTLSILYKSILLTVTLVGRESAAIASANEQHVAGDKVHRAAGRRHPALLRGLLSLSS